MSKEDTKPAEPIRLAIIDDDPSYLYIACYFLRQHYAGVFEVTTFPDPLEIYEPQWVVHGFDAYLVDYNLGHSDGIDLIKTLRGQIHKGPFILCAGVLDERSKRRAKEAGIDLIIEKDQAKDADLGRMILALVKAKPNAA